jgi:four helix bundle protein
MLVEKARCFEDLWIWQQARILVKHIYRDFSHGKGAQDFGFLTQVQKAGISIMNNIAEGFERSSDLDFARFLDIAKGSCGEVRSMYYSAEDLDYVKSEIAEERRTHARRISAGIRSLTGHVRPCNC